MDWHNLFVLLIGLYQIEQTVGFLDSLNFENACSDPEDFTCDNEKCMIKAKRCDGKTDCVDGTDELHCDEYLCREPTFFRCSNERCISSFFTCDGENDCGDYSDERNCTNFEAKKNTNTSCGENEWMCKDRLCIPKEWVCNEDIDCLDGSDETLGCSVEMECDGFKCHNNHCVPLEWHCDGSADCIDGSDELNCEMVYEPKDCTVDHRKFLCKNNKTCIDLKLLCDGTPQCPDQSDESASCKAADKQCSLHNCSHDCVQTPTGPLCLCPKGYHQIADKQCVDINECELYGICDQKCRNTAGSYECYCDNKYSLQKDKRTCKVNGGEAIMIFSSKTEIRAYFLTSKLYYSVAKNLKQVVGVSFDGFHIYWTDINIENEAIIRADEDGSNRELLVRSGLGAPEDLAVDWITGNIYFTDGEMQFIGVCNNNGTSCTVLVNGDIDKPRGIVLNPHAGEMFWSDWGKKPEIAKASMDGSNDISFVSNDIHWPNGLAIDYPNQRLYWVDAKLSSIESILLDGTDRRVILAGVTKHPYGIAVFEDKLFWSDWETNSIQYCDKFTGKNHHTLIKEKKQFIYGVHIFHSALKQRTNNPCKDAMCSDICLLNNNTYTCACPQDKTLSVDKHTCKQSEKKRLLAVGAGDLLILIEHQILGRHDINILPVSFSQINYLTYDSVSGSLIVSDKLQNKIYSVDLNKKESKVLVSTGIGQIGGMDHDYFTNNLYWCDTKLATVEVMSLTTNERKTIMSNLAGETPLDIALVPEDGIMFVAFKKPEQGVHIDRIHMDGQGGRTHVVEQGLIGPISLTYDSILKRVFWSDSHTGNIESTSIDGDDRHAFRSLMTDPVSISTLANDLFWTNAKSRRIFWADKHNDKYTHDKKITLDISKDIESMQLTSISGVRIESHPCLTNNGGCSHICLQSLKDHICTCPLGQILTSDNKTCFAPKYCNIDEYKCTTTEICIPKTLHCDGKKDCMNGDDEENCVKERRCPHGMFECINGECIANRKVCDLHYDCHDKSDELNCNGFDKQDSKECPSGSFMCKDGKCIAERLRCDNIQDCNDGTDEENCHTVSCNIHEFRCNSGECIPKTWECDRETDCQDGSDEHERCGPATCSSNLFTCGNGRCIDKALKCNFMDDCGDFSDEIGCKQEEGAKIHQCPEFEFLCHINSTICVPEIARCNGTSECPNGDDEFNCENCQMTEFECLNKKCISKSWVCDKHDDCGDKSDEEPTMCIKYGTNHSVPFERQAVSVPCEHGFRCKTGHCIELTMVCNGVENCYDGSDEYGSCETACELNNNPCLSVCHKTPSGPKCACQEGYKLKGDGQSCEDINECEQVPQKCSQLCENKLGSFTCSCYQGYELRADKTSCKAIGNPMFIVFTSKNEIRKLSPSINTLELIYSEEVPKITGMDMSIKTGDIYFSLEDVGMIQTISLKTKKRNQALGLGKPQKLAVDWITDNVYFVDAQPSSKKIKVCHMDEQKCATILELDIHDQISSLVVDSVNQYIFYSTTSWWLFNAPTSAIYKCNLDGSKVHELVKNDLGYITGLAYDYNKKILYISDQHANQIQAIDYDGKTRYTVLSSTFVHNPMGLSLFEDHIYFLNPNGHMVKCKIYGLQKICSLIKLHAFTTEMFSLIQESKQPSHENICVGHNCTHLCIQSEVGVQCICEDGNVIPEGIICPKKTRLNVNNDEKQVIFLDQSKTSPHSNSHSSVGSTISALIIIILIVISSFITYKYIRARNSGKFDVSMRFLNPAYGMQIPNSTPQNNINLQPGQHEYTNPVLINAQDMQSAASVILQKAKQNPFVMADTNSESEIANSCDSKKLINI